MNIPYLKHHGILSKEIQIYILILNFNRFCVAEVFLKTSSHTTLTLYGYKNPFVYLL